MGNKRYIKDISSDSLSELYMHGISGGSGEHKLYSCGSEGFADDELNQPTAALPKDPKEPKHCSKCKVQLDHIARYCRNCYLTRSEWMPQKPTRKLRKLEISLVSSDEESVKEKPTLSKFSNLSVLRQRKRFREDSSEDDIDFEIERRNERLKRREYVKKIMYNSYEETSDWSTDCESVCMLCHRRPIEAVLVHDKTAHMCVCEKCAVVLDYKKEKCPACGKKVNYYLTGYDEHNKQKF